MKSYLYNDSEPPVHSIAMGELAKERARQPPAAHEAQEPPMWAIAVLVCACTMAVLGLLSGCASVLTPPTNAGQLIGCKSDALARAQGRALDECGDELVTCQARDSILSQLDSDLEACDRVAAEE